MAGGKLTPRQKMINMMYLVLTALLAMNVSKEILNAFNVVNRSIDKSNTLIDEKNDKVLKVIEAERKNDPEKIEKLMNIANQVKAKSDDLTKFIDNQMKTINTQSDKDDDLDVAMRVMVEQKQGAQLLNKLKAYKEDVEKLMVDFPLENFPLDLAIPKTEHAENAKTWELAYFGGVPKIAANTILLKFKNDIKGVEAIVFDRLSKEASTQQFVLDKFEPIYSASSSYVLSGDKYEATIGLGAYSTNVTPEIYVNGRQLPVKDGKATFEQVTSAAGTFKLKTLVKIPKRDGSFEEVSKDIEYSVGVPAGAAVMLDKMNVLYIGVDNPLTVSSGSGDEKTVVTASGGGVTLNKVGPGKYIAKATTVGKATLKVAVQGASGPPKDFELRVKRIPDPVPTLGGKLKGGNAQAGTLKAQSGVVALLENFDFEARFTIKSFVMLLSSKGDLLKAETNGPVFNEQMQGFLSRARVKDVIIIDDITAVGPDGTTRKLGNIAFTII